MNEKVVAVAKDVLSRLNRLNLQKNNGYLVRNGSDWGLEVKGGLQKVVDEMEGHCEVCVLGACLLSAARLYEEVPILEIITAHKELYFTEDIVLKLLFKVFTEQQCLLMEAAFEKDATRAFAKPYIGNTPYLAEKFGEMASMKSPRLRVLAIMRNVIQNNGEFDPTQPPDTSKLRPEEYLPCLNKEVSP